LSKGRFSCHRMAFSPDKRLNTGLFAPAHTPFATNYQNEPLAPPLEVGALYTARPDGTVGAPCAALPCPVLCCML
jgi:hypothetical protein